MDIYLCTEKMCNTEEIPFGHPSMRWKTRNKKKGIYRNESNYFSGRLGEQIAAIDG